MKNFFRKATAFFILTAVTAGIFACGAFGGPDDDAEFASRGNHERSDILVDGMDPADTANAAQNGQNEQPIRPPENIPGNPRDPAGTTRLRFLAAGDNIVHQSVFEDAAQRAGSEQRFNFLPMYDGIAHLVREADIAFINMETPIAGEHRNFYGFPNFNTPKEAAEAIMELGFNVINIANNHMMDMEEQGYKNHLDYWDAQDVLYIGGYRNKDDFENIRVFEKDGISIAWVSFTYGTNGMHLPAGSQMFIPLISDNLMIQQVQRAKTKADLVFVSMHWGPEDRFSASAEQRRQAQILVDNGVDVIIGHHPHVLQEVKWVDRTNYSGGGQTLIAYSLGNLISTQHPLINMVGGLLQFDIVKNPHNEITIESPLLIPVMTHYITPDFQNRPMERRGLQVYLLENYTQELLEKHGTHYRTENSRPPETSGRAITLDLVKSLVTNHVDREFLPDFFK